jgi:hypothetical protein
MIRGFPTRIQSLSNHLNSCSCFEWSISTFECHRTIYYQKDTTFLMELPNLGEGFASSSSANPNSLSSFSPDLARIVMQWQQSTQVDAAAADPITRGTWSEAEDALLQRAVDHLGTKRWIDVAKFVPSRSSKQCRERWFNGLCPNIKHEPFEAWEDEIIVARQRELGNRWSVIARQLPGRSTNSIKNRWYSGLKPQIDAQLRYGIRLPEHEYLPGLSGESGSLTRDFAVTMRPQDHESDPANTDL